MRLIRVLLGINRNQKAVRKSIKDYQQEILARQGRDQIMKLLKLGQMPVALM